MAHETGAGVSNIGATTFETGALAFKTGAEGLNFGAVDLKTGTGTFHFGAATEKTGAIEKNFGALKSGQWIAPKKSGGARWKIFSKAVTELGTPPGIHFSPTIRTSFANATEKWRRKKRARVKTVLCAVSG